MPDKKLEAELSKGRFPDRAAAVVFSISEDGKVHITLASCASGAAADVALLNACAHRCFMDVRAQMGTNAEIFRSKP